VGERNSEKKDSGEAEGVPTGHERYRCQIECYGQRSDDYGGSEIDITPGEVPVRNDFKVNIELLGQESQLDRSTVGVVLNEVVPM
jgi:hypothetical protein